jgi:hypothetical protein
MRISAIEFFKLCKLCKIYPVVITFAADPGYADGDLIRIDNVQGSTELNNNTYYVKSVTYSSGSDYYYGLYKGSSHFKTR